MSTCFFLHSTLPLDETRARVAAAQEKYHDVLIYFWISEVGVADDANREADAEVGFTPQSGFMIQWNKERSELLRRIPVIFYEVFGKDKILVRDNNYDVIPPPQE
jgi:hypothetical protein